MFPGCVGVLFAFSITHDFQKRIYNGGEGKNQSAIRGSEKYLLKP